MTVRRSGLIARHLASAPGPAVLVAVLVVIMAALAALAPRALEIMHTRALHTDLAAMPADQRDLGSSVLGLPPVGPGGSDLPADAAAIWGGFDAQVEGVRAGIDAPLARALGPAEYFLALDSIPVVYPGSGPHTELSLAYDPRSAERVRYTSGSPPRAREDGVLEVSLSETNANAMDWTVGQEHRLSLETDAATTVVLSGVFEPADAHAGYWQHAPLLLHPSVEQIGTSPPVYTGTGIVAAASVPGLETYLVPPRLALWYPLSPDALDATDAGTALDQLRAFQAEPPTLGISRAGGYVVPIAFRSKATTGLALWDAKATAVDSVLAMIAAGPVGVMIAVLVLGCRVIAQRRGSALRLLQARGASETAVRALLAVEGLVVGVPAAAAGWVVAIALTPAAREWALWPAAIAALVPAVLLAASAAWRPDGRHDLSARTNSPVRIVIESVVIVLAIAATVLLLQRRDAATTGGLDPLLIAAPLLEALAACVIALRLYPLPLSWLMSAGSRRAGLTAFLGPARALRERSGGLTPVLALVVGIAVAVSSAVLLATVQQGIARTAQVAVGADLRVRSAAVTPDELARIRAVDGVEAATGVSAPQQVFVNTEGRRTSVAVVVVDAGSLADVQADVPGAIPVTGLAAAGGDVPVVATASLSELFDSGPADIRGRVLSVAGTVPDAAALTTWPDVLLVDASRADEVVSGGATSATVLLRLRDGADAAAVSAAIEPIVGADASIDAPSTVQASLQSDPATTGLTIALTAAIAISALLSALALAMTLVLGAPARARTVGLLRVLGAGRGSTRAIAVWESAPPAVAALVVGAGLGVLLPFVVRAGVDLTAFTGGRAEPAIQIDPLLCGGLVLGFAAATAACTIAALAVSRRARASVLLRSVEEG